MRYLTRSAHATVIGNPVETREFLARWSVHRFPPFTDEAELPFVLTHG